MMTPNEELRYMYNLLKPNQQIEFFRSLTENEFDIMKAFQDATRMGIVHDEVEAYIGPKFQFVIGNDYYEYDHPNIDPVEEVDFEDADLENIIHLYSDKQSIIDDHIKELFESGEILMTINWKKNFKLGYYRCVQSLNFQNSNKYPIIPINYN